MSMTQETLLFYGDNLRIMRDHLPDSSVDLVYLDPPFKSNRSYNILFKEHDEHPSEAQIRAFDDTWHWGPQAEETFRELSTSPRVPERVSRLVEAMRRFLGQNDVMAYLVMMTPRLLELQRVLKPTGSLYLHCDPTASHYLKLVLDTIFGPRNFRNEIVWHYRKWPSGRFQYQRNHDTILFYTRSVENRHTFDIEYMERTESTRRRFGDETIVSGHDAAGRRVPSRTLQRKSVGVPLDDVWEIRRVPPIKQLFPTQKPQALVERIIERSSMKGELILDPFCGCGTTIVAAEKLGRRWIGIDVTHLAISLIRNRLKDMFPGVRYRVVGEPEDLSGARALALENRYQFQWWALSLIQARPLGGEPTTKRVPAGRRGRDRGVDGVIVFLDEPRRAPKRALISVKSGRVTPAYVRELRGTVEREKAAVGILITLEQPTQEMISEAASAGFYHSDAWNRDYPRIQMLTIEQLLAGAGRVQLPMANATFKRAERAQRDAGQLEI